MPFVQFSSDTETRKCPFMDNRSFPRYIVSVSVPQSLQQKWKWEPTLSQCDPSDPCGPATGRSLGTEELQWEHRALSIPTDCLCPCVPSALLSLALLLPRTEWERKTVQLHFQMWLFKCTFYRLCSRHTEQNQAAVSGT